MADSTAPPDPHTPSSTAAHEAYYALALQLTCRAVNRLSVTEARAAMAAALERVDEHIGAAMAFHGRDIRLVVLPEYFATGFPMGEPVEAWSAKACLHEGCAEYERLGQIAHKYAIYLAGNGYELDRHFPGLYFQTSFVLSPAGAVILRYRRLNSMYTATPHDVWDAYLDRYGLDGVFPVARTPIGNLAAVASEEILYPELARCAVIRGAEILLHSTSEIHRATATPKDIAKQARAIENMAYVVSSNSAGITGTPVPAGSTDGGSRIIDHRGHILAEAAPGESMNAHAEIDLAALRRARRRPGMSNLLSRQRFEAYHACYGQASFYPPNSLAQGQPSRPHFVATQERAILRLIELGVLS